MNAKTTMKRNPGMATTQSSWTKPSAACRPKVKFDVSMATPAKDKIREVTGYDFEEIRRNILSKRCHGILNLRDAFVDKSFPPDKGSLTYVYSGDDKYDRMTFRRPPELSPTPLLNVRHGVSPVTHAVRRWTGRQWLLRAFSTLSLNSNFMNRLIPSRRNISQNFMRNYTGAFLFVLWRFGEWVEVIIDDFLPILDGQPAFCPAFGDPPIFWPALLEKAYAKCNKAYEAIEVGNPLSALTDFTGAICEHYKPNESITNELFHVIYKSSANRSLIVVWRSAQSFRESAIRPGPESDMRHNIFAPSWDEDMQRWQSLKGPHMFVVTGATKFPLRDGRMLETIRLKCPHDPGATWWGDFSVKNPLSWHSLHPTFAENYKPKDCLDGNEFWIPYIEFCRHFADLVICSSIEPYHGFESSQTRKSFSKVDDCFDTDTELSSQASRTSIDINDINRAHAQLGLPVREHLYEKRGSIEITVKESVATVKLDTRNLNPGMRRYPKEVSGVVKRRPRPEANGSSFGRATPNLVKGDNVTRKCNNRIGHEDGKNNHVPVIRSTTTSALGNRERTQSSSSSLTSTPSKTGSSYSEQDFSSINTSKMDRDPSIASNLSEISAISNNSLSDTESTNSASEIKIRLKSSQSRYERPSSAPAKSPVHMMMAPAKSFNASIFETRLDYFRPQGSWRTVVEQKGAWTKSSSGGPPNERESHSKNPRVFFALSKPDAVNEVISADLHGKCHVLISLLQDQRRGAPLHNSMLVDIGFCLYRSKSPEKDDKRHLSKLQLLHDVTSASESREVTARFDLEPGYYMLVPYTKTVNQEGHFLLRILGEKDQVTGKTGCVVS